VLVAAVLFWLVCSYAFSDGEGMSFSFPFLCEWEISGGGIPGDGGGHGMLFWPSGASNLSSPQILSMRPMGVQCLWCILVVVLDVDSYIFIKV
jgi:hypothetical protein